MMIIYYILAILATVGQGNLLWLLVLIFIPVIGVPVMLISELFSNPLTGIIGLLWIVLSLLLLTSEE